MFNSIWGHLSYFLKDFVLYLSLLIFSTVFAFYFLVKIYKSKVNENTKNVLLLCLFTLLSLVYVISGFEAYFRYKYDQTDGLGFLQTNQRWLNRHVRYNNIIYRDNKSFLPQRQDGVVKIGVVGDSLAFGWGIKNINDRFSNILETNLNKNGYNVEVYNFGIPGQNTCNEISQFKSIDYIHMDIIVWEYYFNGIEPCDSRNVGNKILLYTNAHMNPFRVFLSKNSFLFDYLYWRFTSAHNTIYKQLRNADLAQYNNPPVFKDHVKDIATLSAQLKFEGNTDNKPRKVVAILFPLLNLWSKSNYPGVSAEKKISEIIQENGVKVIDMLPIYMGKTQSELTINSFDAHPNEYVNKIVAEKLYDQIVSLLTKTNDGKTVIK